MKRIFSHRARKESNTGIRPQVSGFRILISVPLFLIPDA